MPWLLKPGSLALQMVLLGSNYYSRHFHFDDVTVFTSVSLLLLVDSSFPQL